MDIVQKDKEQSKPTWTEHLTHTQQENAIVWNTFTWLESVRSLHRNKENFNKMLAYMPETKNKHYK